MRAGSAARRSHRGGAAPGCDVRTGHRRGLGGSDALGPGGGAGRLVGSGARHVVGGCIAAVGHRDCHRPVPGRAGGGILARARRLRCAHGAAARPVGVGRCGVVRRPGAERGQRGKLVAARRSHPPDRFGRHLARLVVQRGHGAGAGRRGAAGLAAHLGALGATGTTLDRRRRAAARHGVVVGRGGQCAGCRPTRPAAVRAAADGGAGLADPARRFDAAGAGARRDGVAGGGGARQRVAPDARAGRHARPAIAVGLSGRRAGAGAAGARVRRPLRQRRAALRAGAGERRHRRGRVVARRRRGVHLAALAQPARRPRRQPHLHARRLARARAWRRSRGSSACDRDARCPGAPLGVAAGAHSRGRCLALVRVAHRGGRTRCRASPAAPGGHAVRRAGAAQRRGPRAPVEQPVPEPARRPGDRRCRVAHPRRQPHLQPHHRHPAR